MYSIVIAILFFILSGWLLNKEWTKDPSARNVWSLLSAILSMVMGIAVTLVWLTQILF
jgi:hypothetical protein